MIHSSASEERTPVISEVEHVGALVRVFTYECPSALGLEAVCPGGTRPVFVAAHGFRGDHHGFEQLIFSLGGTWAVCDFPGFGASTPMTGQVHSAEAFARLLARLVSLTAEQHPGRPVIVVGHSFGSVIVSRAAEGLGQAAGVVLINPISAPALEGASALATGAATAYYRLARQLPESIGLPLLRSRLITDGMSLAMRTRREPEIRAYVHQQHRSYFAGFRGRDVLLEAYASSLRDSVRESAAGISQPTLLITSTRDAFGTEESQQRLAALIPDCRRVSIEGIGHLVHYEAAADAARAIADFAQDLDAPGEPLA